MTVLHVEIPDELYKKLRIEVINRSSSKKGALKQAVKEAIELWLNKDK